MKGAARVVSAVIVVFQKNSAPSASLRLKEHQNWTESENIPILLLQHRKAARPPD